MYLVHVLNMIYFIFDMLTFTCIYGYVPYISVLSKFLITSMTITAQCNHIFRYPFPNCNIYLFCCNPTPAGNFDYCMLISVRCNYDCNMPIIYPSLTCFATPFPG